MRFLALYLFFFSALLFPTKRGLAQEDSKTIIVDRILSMTIESSINPATLNYLKGGFEKANNPSFDLILIKINTPGGLVSTTKEILTLFGNSQKPVVVWVRPEGASATSAGAIIASGAHILLMSDGTNIGAATPIEMGKDIQQKDLRKKAINDLVALVQSLAETRGRNSKEFAKMISEAASFKSQDALNKKLIDGIVNTHYELKNYLNDKTVIIQGEKKLLKTADIEIVEFDMDWGQKLLDIFANPSLAYILFLIGAALIYLELQAPGGFIAGGVGAICLILAGIGFQVLPLNFGALGLIVLSFILFIMEVYITSYGILTLAGLASLISGSMFLYRTNNAYIELSQAVIFSSVGAIVLFLVFIIFVITRDHKNIGREKFNSLIGKKGQIKTIIPSAEDGHYIYQIKVGGEIWRAESDKSFQEGDWVEIIDQNNEEMYLNL